MLKCKVICLLSPLHYNVSGLVICWAQRSGLHASVLVGGANSDVFSNHVELKLVSLHSSTILYIYTKHRPEVKCRPIVGLAYTSSI